MWLVRKRHPREIGAIRDVGVNKMRYLCTRVGKRRKIEQKFDNKPLRRGIKSGPFGIQSDQGEQKAIFWKEIT